MCPVCTSQDLLWGDSEGGLLRTRTRRLPRAISLQFFIPPPRAPFGFGKHVYSSVFLLPPEALRSPQTDS